MPNGLSNCHWELQKCVLRVAVFLARETKLGPVVSACERPVSVEPSITSLASDPAVLGISLVEGTSLQT
jgi:hypothetical protein